MIWVKDSNKGAWLLKLQNKPINEQELEEFKKTIIDKYNIEGGPYYGTARIWDDGIIDPKHSRDVIALSLKCCLNSPINDTNFGVFRM